MNYRRHYENLMWALKGHPIPPADPVKLKTVRGYAQKYEMKTLVETGTCLGQMVNDTKDIFDHIYSIELDDHLYCVAKYQFASRSNIHIIRGDSSKELPELIKWIRSPILFWLDAHYSGGATARGDVETPIVSELTTILNHPNVDKHIILIDDARLFLNATPGYPLLGEVTDLVDDSNPSMVVTVKDDIIRIRHVSKI